MSKDKKKKKNKKNKGVEATSKKVVKKNKGEKKVKAEKKASTKKETKVVQKELKIPKGLGEDLKPETGTRFPNNSARQLAFDVVMKGVKAKKNIKDIRKDLLQVRKENGHKYNLDGGYANYVVSAHPEFFNMYSDGTIELITEPTVDKEALKADKKKTLKASKKVSKEVKKMRKKKKNKKAE